MYQNRKTVGALLLLFLLVISGYSFQQSGAEVYAGSYHKNLDSFRSSLYKLKAAIDSHSILSPAARALISTNINDARMQMKTMDFWMRYLEPIAFKKINGPLPVEWETEVFEKFEAPYKREGAGLTLAAAYLEEEGAQSDSLSHLIEAALEASDVFQQDSITSNLTSPDHFYLCNRLFLLNLATIYTTGFECPDSARVIPELINLLHSVKSIYTNFNAGFNAYVQSPAYTALFDEAIRFCEAQPADYSLFDHYSFLRNYVNPLFRMNQVAIARYAIRSRSNMDYTLNRKVVSIFSKELYHAQNNRGIFHRVTDPVLLQLIDSLGKMLFFDPILSGNNERSCASCHKPGEAFTDNSVRTAPSFGRDGSLERNTPSLLNAGFNHLLMIDGRHLGLQQQARAVISDEKEMACQPGDVLQKILSCPDYKKAFERLLPHTPTEKQIGMDHITSALTTYYSKFSDYASPFDRAMNGEKELDADARKGFDLFMSKAQCATCHFAPQFNGVKPPFAGSEFEVLGVPATKDYKGFSKDSGRYRVNPATETLHAFRTGTLRNISRTAPYMHNGVFQTLDEVIDFYDGGGGAGRGLNVPNQTLSSDSLHLSPADKKLLIHFMKSLDEDIPVITAPAALPRSKNKNLNRRIVGGTY